MNICIRELEKSLNLSFCSANQSKEDTHAKKYRVAKKGRS